jgi:hypothetical protein
MGKSYACAWYLLAVFGHVLGAYLGEGWRAKRWRLRVFALFWKPGVQVAAAMNLELS